MTTSSCVPVQLEKLSYSCAEGKRPAGIEIKFLYRDDQIAIVNKPADVSLLADRSGADCLWDSLPGLLGQKPFLVHRLDKPTSGVLAIALNQQTQKQLTRAFAARAVAKFYLAWVLGDPGTDGVIDLPLKKGRKSRFRIAGQRAEITERNRRWSLDEPDADGHESETRFRRLKKHKDRSLLLLMPKTGRTHQLRVHLSWIGHPILGDQLYGKPEAAEQQAARLYLHAHKLILPDVGCFSAPLEPLWPEPLWPEPNQ
jgi:RluA family pseudouridine synthase